MKSSFLELSVDGLGVILCSKFSLSSPSKSFCPSSLAQGNVVSWDIEALNRYMSFIAIDRSNASVTVVFVSAFIGERLHLYVKKEPSYVTDRIIMLVNIVQLALLNLKKNISHIIT